MSDESVELEIELKDGVSKPAKRMSNALQRLAADASRTQTRVMQRNFRESTKGHKRYLDRQFRAAKQEALIAKRATQIREAQGSGFDRLTKSVGILAGGLGMASVALGAMGIAAGAVLYPAAKLGGALIESAKSAGNLRFALGQLTHTDGRAELENITKLAADLGLNIESTAHSYAGLLKMQFKPDDAKTWVKFGADMQALGNSAEEVEGILLAVSQIKAKGRLQAQEMLQLAERGVSQELVYKALSEQQGSSTFGKSTKEIQGIQEKGNISDEMGLAAIQSALMEKMHTSSAGEAAQGYVKSFAGSMQKGESQLQRVGLGLGAAFERGFSDATASAEEWKNAGYAGFGTAAGGGGFFDKMQNSPVIEKLGGFVERLGNAFAYLMPYLLEVGNAFVSGFTDGAGLEDAMNPDTVRTFAYILRDEIVPAAQTVGKVIGWVSTKVLQFTGLWIAGAAYITNGVTGMVDAAGSLVTGFQDLGSRVVDGFIGGLSAGWQRTKDAVGGWADGAVNWAAEKFGIHSPSKEFAALGKYSVQGYQQGLDSLAPQLPSAGAMVPSSLSAPGGSNSFSVVINVDGSKDPGETARMVRLEFESMFSGMMGRFAEGIA